MRLRNVWIRVEKSSPSGESVSSSGVWRVWKNCRVGAVPAHFPPDVIVAIKALACELPAQSGVPLSRWDSTELAAHARRSGLVASSSGTTIWRWLHADAIRPWQHRCWIFPRDPPFAEKAGRILDLYERIGQGPPLRDDEFVLSADEKTSLQARARRHPTLPPQPGLPMKIEHAYRRCGAWAYLAAWDVHRAQLFGRCEARNGIAPFDRLVDQVMSQPPLPASAARLLDPGPRLGPPHSGVRFSLEVEIPDAASCSRPRPCELVKSNRNLLLNPPAQGPYTE